MKMFLGFKKKCLRRELIHNFSTFLQSVKFYITIPCLQLKFARLAEVVKVRLEMLSSSDKR